MTFTITQTLLNKYNRPRIALIPKGIVIHDTEGHNDSDEGNFNYFNGADRSASAHYFVDNDSISQFIPDNEEAWHAGSTANHLYLSMEICHVDNDPVKFKQTWDRAVWLAATKCIQYGWNPHNTDQFLSHKMVSDRWHESTHQDPIAYFAIYNKTFNDFINDVVAEITTLKVPATVAAAPKPISNPTPAKPVVQSAPVTQPTSSSVIKAVGQIKIVGVSNAAIIMDAPDRNNAKNVGTIKLGATISISGSVIGKNNGNTGYWEVIYNNKRCYISAQYGKKI